jgi:hypothetical protein
MPLDIQINLNPTGSTPADWTRRCRNRNSTVSACALGWMQQDEADDCEDEEVYHFEVYDPKTSWMYFTLIEGGPNAR